MPTILLTGCGPAAPGPSGGPATGDGLILEDNGGFLLLEDGTSFLLLES